MSWFERNPKFFVEVFDNLDLRCIIDLFGSAQMAIATLMSHPPRSYLGFMQSEEQLRFTENAVDHWIDCA